MKKDPNRDALIKRMDSIRDLTVAELLFWCTQHNLDPSDVNLSPTHVFWFTPRTDEELEQYDRWIAEADALKDKWQKDAMFKYAEKFGYTLVDKE